MDLISIVNNDTTGNISKRLMGKSLVDGKLGGGPEVLPATKVATNTNPDVNSKKDVNDYSYVLDDIKSKVKKVINIEDYASKLGQDIIDKIYNKKVVKSHINYNLNMVGRYLPDVYNLSEGSMPYEITELGKALMEEGTIPTLSEIQDQLTKLAKDKIKELAKSLLDSGKTIQGKDLDKLEDFSDSTRRSLGVLSDNSIKKVNPDEFIHDEYLWDIMDDKKWVTRYENNSDKHLGPYFRGLTDVSEFEGRVDRFYDFEIHAPQSLVAKDLPKIPAALSGINIDKTANISDVKSISLESGDTLSLGTFGSPIRSINLSGNVASITTEFYETEDIAVRTWLNSYIKYMYGDDPTPLVHRSIYVGYYYITFYYLNTDRSKILERTFYGVPTFDLSMTPTETIKSFQIVWNIIGESPTRED